MSKPFSFLSPRRTAEAPAAGAVGSVEVNGSSPAAANVTAGVVNGVPATASGSLFHRPIPYMPPMGASPSSVISAALQAAGPPEREAPSPHRPQTGPAESAPAAPSLAALAAAAPPSPWPKDQAPGSAPAAWSAGQISSREVAQFRVEMREELEQVRNDLFGAATGVSAVKDRLDGLEARMAGVEEALAIIAARGLPTDFQKIIEERIQQVLREAAEQAPGGMPEVPGTEGGARAGAAGPLRQRELAPLSAPPQVLSSCSS